ncbi:MAG: hypothetical protein B7Y99_12635 [Caulobacterales bacterium 32-69-10]|nr:MAG: hypothetical protein B7Y99_12635 [Caulobacterales bacterium 32-69-10]
MSACAVALVGLAACSQGEGPAGKTKAVATGPAAVCASEESAATLKKIIFDKARDLASGPSKLAMSRVSELSTLKLERPVVDTIDEATGKTSCSSLIRLTFPVGAIRSLGADSQTSFEGTYTVQPAADGSGMVYALVGANPIIEAIGYSDFDEWAKRYEAVATQAAAPADTTVPTAVSSPAMAAPVAVAANQAPPTRVAPRPTAEPAPATPSALRSPYAGDDNHVCENGDPQDRRTIEACDRRDLGQSR